VDGLAAVWLRCRAAAGPAELTVLFNRLAAVCEPRSMSVKGWNNAKVGGAGSISADVFVRVYSCCAL
jgi:hypothetical protein